MKTEIKISTSQIKSSMDNLIYKIDYGIDRISYWSLKIRQRNWIIHTKEMIHWGGETHEQNIQDHGDIMRKSNTQIIGIGKGFLVKEIGNVFNKIIKIIP